MKTNKQLAQLFNTINNWDTVGTDTQYKIIGEENELIIAFYGSNSKADWKNNLAFRKKPYKNMPVPFSVHRGFLKAWKLINDHFIDLVKNVNKPITIIGYSADSERYWFVLREQPRAERFEEMVLLALAELAETLASNNS